VPAPASVLALFEPQDAVANKTKNKTKTANDAPNFFTSTTIARLPVFEDMARMIRPILDCQLHQRAAIARQKTEARSN
jgi:hypothetical protein